MQEIGRGQHGTVRLGRDMTSPQPTPEHSRAATANSTNSTISPATPIPSHGLASGAATPNPNSLVSASSTDLARRQSEVLFGTSSQVLSDPDLPSLSRDKSLMAGNYWAIKIVDRMPRRKLPGVGGIKKGLGGLGGAGGVSATGEK